MQYMYIMVMNNICIVQNNFRHIVYVIAQWLSLYVDKQTWKRSGARSRLLTINTSNFEQ